MSYLLDEELIRNRDGTYTLRSGVDEVTARFAIDFVGELAVRREAGEDNKCDLLVRCPGDFVSANSAGWIGVGPTERLG